MKRPTLLLCLIVLSLLACGRPQLITLPSEDALSRDLDAVFAPWNRDDSPGGAVVVLQDGEPLYRRGFGVVSLDTGKPIDPAITAFDLGSIGKQQTAYAVLLLEQRGLLSLDDDVRAHLPWIPDFGSPISIRRLMDHTSGLREYLTLASLHKRVEGPLEQRHVREWLKDQRGLNFPPGERHMYSNTGFFVLAELVEAVSGRSFHDFMADEVFRPLGMDHTQVRRYGDGERIATRSYGPSEGRLIEAPVIWRARGAGGIAGTVDDLARWTEHMRLAHHNSEIVRAMTRRGRDLRGELFDYGLGIRHTRIHGVDVVWHGGSGMAFQSWTGYLPEHGVTVALSQNNYPGVGNINEDLLRPIFEHLGLMTDASTEAPLEGPFHDYAGHFAEDTFRVQLEATDGELFLVSATRGRRPVTVWPGGTLRTASSELFAELDEQGRATAIGFFYGAQKVVMPRIELVDPSTVDFDSLVGTYHLPELDIDVHIGTSEQRLIVELGEQKHVYVPTLPGRFHVERGPSSSISFTYDEQGRVDGALLNLIRSHRIRLDKKLDS